MPRHAKVPPATPVVIIGAVESVGTRLRRLRRMRGYSQMELAARSGLHQTAISAIERGYTEGLRIELETAWRLAWGLGITIDMLAGVPEFPRNA